MKPRYGFLYVQNLNKEWKVVLLSMFNAEGENLLDIAIAEPHAPTSPCRIQKIMKALTNKFAYQYFSRLVKEHIGSCNI